jgi:hypothetical protein
MYRWVVGNSFIKNKFLLLLLPNKKSSKES